MTKFKGMGGHMTASLIHDIEVLYRIYDAKIQSAWMHNDGRTAQSLADSRDEKIRKVQARLSERGYTYVMRSRSAASLKPPEAELPEELKRSIRAQMARRMFAELMKVVPSGVVPVQQKELPL